MNKIGIFDPNIGKTGSYIDHWQCERCDQIYKDRTSIWNCTTCNLNTCDSCKENFHKNHNAIRNDYTTSKAHPLDCTCNICDDPYQYLPIVDQLILSDNIILLKMGDFNPELLESIIPPMIFEEYPIENKE